MEINAYKKKLEAVDRLGNTLEIGNRVYYAHITSGWHRPILDIGTITGLDPDKQVQVTYGNTKVWTKVYEEYVDIPGKAFYNNIIQITPCQK